MLDGRECLTLHFGCFTLGLWPFSSYWEGGWTDQRASLDMVMKIKWNNLNAECTSPLIWIKIYSINYTDDLLSASAPLIDTSELLEVNTIPSWLQIINLIFQLIILILWLSKYECQMKEPTVPVLQIKLLQIKPTVLSRKCIYWAVAWNIKI